MRELSLFSGAGGGLLGTHLLGWRPVGYVEKNDYCQRVIAARIKDGILPEAPIFGDIRAFLNDGYAAAYQGLVDVITAGFPCQPFSIAGRRRGGHDERNMWPATIQCIRLVRPRYALLENVPGLLVHRYFGTILRTLAESGYVVSWRVLSAAEFGAPHKRDRLWIIAHSQNQHWPIQRQEALVTGRFRETLADSAGDRRVRDRNVTAEPCEIQERNDVDAGGQAMANAEYHPVCYDEQQDKRDSCLARPAWFEVEPDVGRVANGVASRMDRLTALGNGQVPAVVRAAWYLLSNS